MNSNNKNAREGTCQALGMVAAEEIIKLMGTCLAWGAQPLGWTGRRPGDRTVCSARAPNTVREALSLSPRFQETAPSRFHGGIRLSSLFLFDRLVEVEVLAMKLCCANGLLSFESTLVRRAWDLFTWVASTISDTSQRSRRSRS